jgi:hypothetical protein
MQAPTATELLNLQAVQRALEQAWLDSFSDDPARRHEKVAGFTWIPVPAQSWSAERQGEFEPQ